jgi:hypothetical protein
MYHSAAVAIDPARRDRPRHPQRIAPRRRAQREPLAGRLDGAPLWSASSVWLFVTLHIPIGIGDFRTLRELDLEYIDKSHLIRELVDRAGVEVVLLPRPRRFGKSLNLSMLRWFFEKRDEDLWPLFDGLHIARAGQAYRAHFQRYPVVYVSFKATRADSFEVCRDSIRLVIRDLYHERVALLERGVLDEWERADFRAVLDGSASEAVYRRSLLCLTGILHRVHGERVIVLIDEYDAPIHAGWAAAAVSGKRASAKKPGRKRPSADRG